MKIPFVDLKAQYKAHQSEIDAAIARVVAETSFIGNLTNPHVKAFEEQFAAYLGSKHCVACANGTDSLEILLKAAGIGAGDEVIVPSVSWIATSEAVSTIGARPVFADIDPLTYTIDPADIARKITPRTKAVIPVHLYGEPADMDAIMVLAQQHGLFVLEDCAQAHGAKYRDRTVGTIGHAGSFSFFPGKNLGAYGDAGGMLTNDEKLAARARMISQHGQGAKKHDHQVEGRNSRMDGIHAAILSVKLPHLEQWTEQRRGHAATYRRLLGESGLQVQRVPEHVRHVYHLFTVQVPNREAVLASLQAAGISAAVQYPQALPLLTAYQHLGHKAADFPVGAALAARVLSLPIYPELTEAMIAHVVTNFLAIVNATTRPA